MRRTALLIVCVSLLIGGNALAQSGVSARGNVGAAFFRSPSGLNSVLNSGVDYGLGLSVDVYRGIQVTVEAGYDQFTLNGDIVALRDENLEVGSSSSVKGGEYSLANVSVGLRYVIENGTDAHPYFSTAAGLFRSKIAKTEVYQSGQLVQEAAQRTTTGFGVQIAAGVNFRINDTYSFFFEPRYVLVDTKDRDFGVGATTRYVPLRMGLDVAL